MWKEVERIIAREEADQGDGLTVLLELPVQIQAELILDKVFKVERVRKDVSGDHGEERMKRTRTCDVSL